MLDSISLAAIAQEARNCFLEEDAPEYLNILKVGIIELKELFNHQKNPQKLANLYKELARAAHSIKGGAGMAEMLIVSQLAHKIEDIFYALQQERVTDLKTTFELLNLGINQLEDLVDSEKKGIINDTNNIELLEILNQFLTTFNPQEELIDIGFADNNFIKIALTEDLSACIERVTEIINNPTLATEENITNNLNILIEECQLLGQALNCQWLVNLIEEIKNLKLKNHDSIKNFTLLSISEIEYHRQQYLEKNDDKQIKFSDRFKNLLLIEKKEEKTTFEENLPQKITHNRNLRVPITKNK